MKNMIFTDIDRQILESYKGTVEGLAAYLGPAYELVLHSLEDLDHSVVLIINGHHTGRSVGSPITDLALSMLEKIQSSQEPGCSHISYFVTNNQGDPLKSTTIAVQGENGRIIAVLCINFYLNTPLSTVLSTLTDNTAAPASVRQTESFMENSQELICSAAKRVQKRVLADNQIPLNSKNKEIITVLNQEGIFKLKDAVNIVSQTLNLSKNTVYMHLRNL